ncbi:MAG: hypothetical protein M3238_01450 [Actinomycetota bacterium]|nr:hypothetical protein [Actinomycetota bacterium]
MGDRQIPTQQEMDEEADSFTGGPGVVATKSQARGGIAGIVIGTIVGAILGFVVSLLFFEGGRETVIAVVAFAVAGAVSGGTAGGFLRQTRKLPPSDADVR